MAPVLHHSTHSPRLQKMAMLFSIHNRVAAMKLKPKTIDGIVGVLVALTGLSAPSTAGVANSLSSGFNLWQAFSNLRALDSKHDGEMPKAIERIKKGLKENFESWVSNAGISEAAFAPAEAALSEVLFKLSPTPDKLFECNRNTDRFLDLIAFEANRLAPHDYGDGADPQRGYNVALLEALFRGTLDLLDGDIDYENKIHAWFQREVLIRLEDQSEMLKELLRRVPLSPIGKHALHSGVSDVTIIAIAKRYTSDVADGDINSALAAIEQAVSIAIEVREEVARGDNFGDEVNEVFERLASLTDQGQLEDAAALADNEITNWELLRKEKQERERALGQRLLQAGINQDVLIGDAKAAAGKLIKQTALAAEPRELSFEDLRELQGQWHNSGRDKGINLNLEIAIEIARFQKEIAKDATQSLYALSDLADSLQLLGKNLGKIDNLKEAEVLFRETIGLTDAVKSPIDFAAGLNSLGVTLVNIATLTFDKDLLIEAANIFKESASYSAKKSSFAWASAQSNYGDVLTKLGQITGDFSYTADAALAFRSALTRIDRQKTPREWAGITGNLAVSLIDVGKHESKLSYVQEGITLLSEALAIFSRDKFPLDWAHCKNSVGRAFKLKAFLERDAKYLNLSVGMHREALTELTRDKVPREWAKTQCSIGITLCIIGVANHDRAQMLEAISAFELALGVILRERDQSEWALAQSGLGDVYCAIGRIDGDTANLTKGILAYKKALLEYESNGMIYKKAATLELLAVAYISMFKIAQDYSQLNFGEEAAIEAMQILEEAASTQKLLQITKLQAEIRQLKDGRPKN